MYKTIIVDDFYLDIVKLRNAINAFPIQQLEIMEECEDGVLALESILKHEPDIVICDIEMPHMDGLELAKQVRERLPRTKFIFCSMYNKFEYARRAIYLDCAGYLLKPVDPQEMYDCVQNVIKQIEEESCLAREYEELRSLVLEKRPVIVQNFVKELLYGFIRDDADIIQKSNYLELNIEKRCFRVAYIEINIDDITAKSDSFPEGVDTENEKAEIRLVISFKTQELIQEVISKRNDFVMVTMDDSHIALLYYGLKQPEKDFPAKEEMTAVLHSLQSACKLYGISLTIAVSDYENEPSKIHMLYKQCEYIIKYKYLFDKNEIIWHEDIPTPVSVPFIDYNGIQSQLKYYLNAGTCEEIRKYYESLFKQEALLFNEQYFKNFCFFLIICMQSVLTEYRESFREVFNDENIIYEKLFQFTTIKDAKKWLTDIAVSINKYLNKKSVSKNNAIVIEIEHYIDTHELKDITIESISNDLHYSANYLNYIYKKERGKSIFDYLCNKKVEKAKELLKNPKYKLYEITELLGYSHTSYFVNVFKKHVGLTPSEYRMRSRMSNE